MRINTFFSFTSLVSAVLIVHFTPVTASAEHSSSHGIQDEILMADHQAFQHFNAKDLAGFEQYLSDELEFFHDTGGFTDKQKTMIGFKKLFQQVPDLTRTLLHDTVEVYEVKGYGAMQVGQHQFCHVENSKVDCGTFKFAHTWQKQNGRWRITRILSYGH